MKIKYLVVYERGPNNYSAFSPDVPGCVSVGEDWEDMQRMMREAISGHVESSILDGDSDPVPQPRHSIIDGIRECIELMDDSGESLTAYECEYNETEDETTIGFLEVEINTQPSEDDFDTSGDDDSFWEDDDDDEMDSDDSRRRPEADPSIRKFVVIFNRVPDSYGAVVPDIPDCISVSDTWEEAQSDVRSAILREMERAKEYGDPAHEPRMSITDAMRYYIELMEDPFLTKGYTPSSYDEQVTFSFVDVEVGAPQSAEQLAAVVSDD